MRKNKTKINKRFYDLLYPATLLSHSKIGANLSVKTTSIVQLLSCAERKSLHKSLL